MMVLSEIPSQQTKQDTPIRPEPDQQNVSPSGPVATRTDRLVVAVVSLVVLICCAILMFGTSSLLHAGIRGWLATLAVIIFAVITTNVALALSGYHPKR